MQQFLMNIFFVNFMKVSTVPLTRTTSFAREINVEHQSIYIPQ